MSRNLGVVIGLVLAFASGPAQAGTRGEDEEALIRRGIALRKARDDVGARVEFQKAYDLTHSAKAAAQLGLAEFALGRWDEAEAHVSEGLRTPGDPWIAKYREELDQSLATIKTHVGRVEVIGDPPGAEIFVNGRAAGRLPLAGSVAVSEGQVDIELRARGFVRGARTVTVSGGQYQRLVIRLEPEGAGSAAGAATAVDPGGAKAPGTGGLSTGPTLPRPEITDAPSTSESSRRAWQVARWTSLGLASVSLATGITATFIHESNQSAFESRHGGGCFDDHGRAVDAAGASVAECQPSLNALRSARTWQIVGFVGAGVFAATWLVLTLVEPTPPTASTTARGQESASWTCGPTLAAAGAACVARF